MVQFFSPRPTSSLPQSGLSLHSNKCIRSNAFTIVSILFHSFNIQTTLPTDRMTRKFQGLLKTQPMPCIKLHISKTTTDTFHHTSFLLITQYSPPSHPPSDKSKKLNSIKDFKAIITTMDYTVTTKEDCQPKVPGIR